MTEKIDELKQLKKRLQRSVGVEILLCIAALALVFVNPAITIAMLGAEAVFYLAVIHRQKRNFQQVFKAYNIEESLRMCLKDVTYQKKDLVTKETVSGWFQENAHVLSLMARDGVRASWQGMPITLCDISMTYEWHPLGDSGGKKAYETIAGIICLADTGAGEGRGCFLDSADFDRADLPELLKKQLVSLREEEPGRIFFGMDGGRAMILIQNRFLSSQMVQIKAEITPRLLRFEQFPELHDVLRIVGSVRGKQK